jgi:hypothetical protein
MSTAQPKSDSVLQQRIKRNIGFLVLMLIVAGVYVAWLGYFGHITGSSRLDGSIGILLGLYICSHPAANMLDILLFMTPDTRESLISIRFNWLWLFLNLLTAFAAWGVIFTGILRFVAHSLH